MPTSTRTIQPQAAFRRTDLDWVRIVAFIILILFHVAMFYAPMEWVVKSPRVQPWLQIPLDWSSPWRLLLLFIVSGAATRFMGEKLALGALFKSRSLRLLPPLIFTMLIVVPPQAYYQAIEQFGYDGNFAPFWGRYLAADSSFCRDGACLAMPSWNHLWFVAYQWIYTVLLIAVLASFPSLLKRLEGLANTWLAGRRLLLVPPVVLILGRLVLKHFFPETHGLEDDWYLHFSYFLCFVFGFVCAPLDWIWAAFMKRRELALGVGIVAYALYAAYDWHYRAAPAGLPLRIVMTGVYGIDQWAWIVAAFGYAKRYLSGRDGPVRRYLTDAIFPYYIVHQTAIVVVAHNLAKFDLPLGLEAALLVAATVISCALTYEIVRRVPWLRLWFGLKRAEPVARSTSRPSAAPKPIHARPSMSH